MFSKLLKEQYVIRGVCKRSNMEKRNLFHKLCDNNRIGLHFMDDTLLIPFEKFKDIASLFKFKQKGKYYTCAKNNDDIVAVKTVSLLDHSTLYSISVTWCSLEYLRTKSKTLENFMKGIPNFDETFEKIRRKSNRLNFGIKFYLGCCFDLISNAALCAIT